MRTVVITQRYLVIATGDRRWAVFDRWDAEVVAGPYPSAAEARWAIPALPSWPPPVARMLAG